LPKAVIHLNTNMAATGHLLVAHVPIHLFTQWLWTYNHERPHTAIGGVPPRYLLNVT
jgi:transposase InsO family protein